MTRHLSLIFIISLFNLLLTSCASLETVVSEKAKGGETVPKEWQAEKTKRQQINLWEIRGRVGVQTAKEGATMDLIWKQSENEYSIRLIAPLGAGTYLIQGDETYAHIRYPDGSKKTVDNIDDVFTSALGVSLPVTAIKDWIRGLPANVLSTESISWNEQHLLHRLKQAGWNVEMTRYTGTGLLMPHAIYLSRDDDNELDVRLILRRWLIDN